MKTALIIDVNNVHHTVTHGPGHENRRLDYSKLLEYLDKKGFRVVVREAYGKFLPEFDRFRDELVKLNFDVVSSNGKPPFDHYDVNIALRCLDLAPEVESIVIVSGKPSLVAIFNYMNRKHTNVHMVSCGFFLHSQLKRAAREYTMIPEELLYEKEMDNASREEC